MKREQYERELAERRRKHMERVNGQYNWQPCLHDSCPQCHGTGLKVTGGMCVHGISCPCPKCTKKKMVVSTVGNILMDNDKRETIGCNRYYETMCFWGVNEPPYVEADIGNQFSDFESEWCISELTHETDLQADKMHEAVVKEISKKLPTLKKGTPDAED